MELLFLCTIIPLLFSGTFGVYTAEQKAEKQSENESIYLVLVITLLILSVLTIWLFKVKRFRFLHETGVCLVYGVLAGLILKYSGSTVQTPGYHVSLPYNNTNPPKTLIVSIKNQSNNYSYKLSGVAHTTLGKSGNELENKAVFDPEVFFYALLPPIIFFAGYDMKKRFFFRNLGAILTFAFIGTTISCLVFSVMIYVFVDLINSDKYSTFNFKDAMLFGSLISATDPVTVLAIFHDLNVEVDLYAIVFGESVLNDAVAIVLYRTIQTNYNSEFTALSFFTALGNFILIFGGSLLLGSFMGLLTAIITKLTNIKQFPRLETALFVLMSYSTFLIAESLKLTGIVTVLFCGIAQAHYTYNNLSKESQVATKEIFGLLNFLAENFIFSYMGLTVFTFDKHQWDGGFIAWSFLAVAISRFLNIYPLSFLLNLKRGKKIPMNFQHMLFFAGLRGAVAFALAIRNTESEARQLMLTAVLMIAIVTVIFNGGLTTQALLNLGIRVNVDQDEDIRREVEEDEEGNIRTSIEYERSWLVRKWHEFDVRYMKPLFTNKGGAVSDLPPCCRPVSSCFLKPPDNDAYERRMDAQMNAMGSVGSVDDEMLDVSVNQNVMTRSISQDRENNATHRNSASPTEPVDDNNINLNVMS